MIAGQPGLFSGGLDVPGLLALDREGISAMFVDLWRVQRAVATSPVPVMFAITGHCPAGGTVLAIHGDYRVMAEGEFRLGLNEVQVGLFPGPGRSTARSSAWWAVTQRSWSRAAH